MEKSIESLKSRLAAIELEARKTKHGCKIMKVASIQVRDYESAAKWRDREERSRLY